MPRNRSEKDVPTEVWSSGTKVWLDDDRLYHRESGPAVESSLGSEEWYIHGLRHRENGPAIEWSDGAKEWWHQGRFTRREAPGDAA